MTKSAARNVSARKSRSVRAKETPSIEARDRNLGNAPKAAAKKRNSIASDTVQDDHRLLAESDPSRRSQLPDAMRLVSERNAAQARELYEGSKNTLQAVVESWQKSFGAAGQTAVAINRKMIEGAARNMEMGFDLAIGLAGARNLGEVMELQAAYWHKIAGALQGRPETRAGATVVKAR
jgi:hypothetical protein